MNNKGQVFALFIIILPVILFIVMLIINQTYLLYLKKSQNNLGVYLCNYALTNDDNEKIKELALKNDSNLKTIEITRDSKTTITLEKEIKNIFSMVNSSNNQIKTKTQCVK